MTSAEKIAYLRGLAEGLGVEAGSKEDKLLSAVIDVLESFSAELSDLGDTVSDVCDEQEKLDGTLEFITSYLFEDEDEEDDGEDEEDDDPDGPVFYEVSCPACGNTITVDEDVLLSGEIACPGCGETLEFDLNSPADDEVGE